MTPPLMPPRNSTAEVVARAAGKVLRLACARHFPIVPLGEVGEVVSGGTPSTTRDEYWGGDIVWVTPKDLGRPRGVAVESAERTITELGLESSSARLLPVGTVLLSSRAPIGHIGIAAKPLATNQGFKNIICSKALDSRFLFHILRGSIDELAAEGRGNTFLEIPGKVVKGFPIPIPSLPIQRAVSDFLDALYKNLSGANQQLPDLPEPLKDQRRVVARIAVLAAKVEEAKTLRHAGEEEVVALPRALLSCGKLKRTIRVRDFATLRPPDVAVDPLTEYHFAGVYSFGRGVFQGQRKLGSEFSYPKLTRLRVGNFVYPKLMAWEGALGVVPPNCDGFVVSTEFPVFEIDEQIMLPEVMDTHFRSPEVWPTLSGQSGGTIDPA